MPAVVVCQVCLLLASGIIQSQVLSIILQIRQLFLSHKHISFIGKLTFVTHNALEVLDISFMALSIVAPEMFTNLTSLKIRGTLCYNTIYVYWPDQPEGDIKYFIYSMRLSIFPDVNILTCVQHCLS